MPLRTARKATEESVRRMQVERPAAIGNGIRVQSLLHDIPLAEDMITLEPAAFPFPGDMAHPFECKVFCFGIFS